MLNGFLIFLGGGLGTLVRWATGNLLVWPGSVFPWSTLFVNVTGSLAIGLFAGMFGHPARGENDLLVRDLLMVGFCGGYTTFSAFSLQTITLIQNGHWTKAILNSVSSFVVCLLAVWLGHLIASYVFPSRNS